MTWWICHPVSFVIFWLQHGHSPSFLPVPQPRQLPAALQVGLHLARETRVEVVLVFRAVRISAAVEFDVRLLVEAHQRQQRLVLVREPPIATLDAPEIPGLDPPLPFV